MADHSMGEPVYEVCESISMEKMTTDPLNRKKHSPVKKPADNKDPTTQASIYYDIIPEWNFPAKNRSEKDDTEIYDDVIPPDEASGHHITAVENVYDDVIVPAAPESSPNGYTRMDSGSNMPSVGRKARPTDLAMPSSQQYYETKDASVRVASIVEKLSKFPPTGVQPMLADTGIAALTRELRAKFAVSPTKASPEKTLYKAESPNSGESTVGGGGGGGIGGYSDKSSPSRLSSRFVALECGSDDNGPMEDMSFDEGEQGFFIDDDLLYEDLLGEQEDEDEDLFGEDDSEYSWGSEEWDGYSDDESDNEMVHSYVIEPNTPPLSANRGPPHVMDNRDKQGALVMSYERQEEEGEKPQVKEFKGRSNLDRVRHFLFGRHSGPKEEEKDDIEEDKDDIHYIDVKLSQVKHPPPALPPQPCGLTSQQAVRRQVVQSIIDSERSYMISLQRLIQAYEKPLLDSYPPLLEKEKVRMIFYRVRGIYQCHLMFQIALSSRVRNWDSADEIGDVFVASFSKAMVLDVYSAYVNNFTNAMEVVKRAASQRPGFRNFIETRQASSIDRLSLYALMLKPIQRFPQFICLLQDLLKRTPPGHTDRMPLQLALTKLETLASVLNERKRQSEQRYAVKQLMKCLNVKFTIKFKNDKSRWLVRQDDMLQTAYDSHGEIIKCKERRLFMLNDLLVCATVLSKTSSPGLSPGLDMSKCKHRWSVPLREVEVVEPTGDGGAEVEVVHEPGKVTITTQPAEEHDYTYAGSARQMYQERNDLIHDMAVVNQIGALLSNLKGAYGTLTKEDVADWSEIIQKLIHKKSQEIKQADVSKIQISLPAVTMGKHVTLVFDAVSSKTKLDWITALETAKLALEPHNNPGWYTSEDNDNTHADMNCGVPLLMKALPVFTTRHSAKVQCAVLCPLEPKFSRSRRRQRAVESEATKNCLWVLSSDNKKSYVAVCGFQPPTPKILELCELGELRVLCAECVPGAARQAGRGPATPGGNTKDTVRRSEFCFTKATVWLGTEGGRICIYEACQLDMSQSLVSFKVPRAVTSMKYLNNRMFLAQKDGTVLIYVRTEEGEWKVKEPRISELGSSPVTALLPVQQHMWCGCGNQVHIIDTESEFTQTDFEVHQEPSQCVQSMVVAGVGVWVSFQLSDIVRLFHTETLQVLQDISVASPIGRMVAGLSPKAQSLLQSVHSVQVTHLLACHGSLWVGTNLGILVNFPLPRLEGVPLVNSPAMVAYHTHGGPVKFMLSLEINRHSDRIHYSSKEDCTDASSTPGHTPHLTPDDAPPRPPAIPPRPKPSTHTANLVTSAMSPMTEYFSLAFDEHAQEDEDDKPSTTDSGACSSNLSEDVDPGSKVRCPASVNQVSASITCTTSLVLCGGEGHHYLIPQDGVDGKSQEPTLLAWQVSM